MNTDPESAHDQSDEDLFQSDDGDQAEPQTFNIRDHDESEDSDAALFDDADKTEELKDFAFETKKEIKGEEENGIVMTITEKVEGVIEKATKKLRTEREKQLAKKAADERIKRVKNAKIFMFLNFSRIATFNTWSMSEFTGCLILSLAPKQYHKYFFDDKLNMSKHLTKAMIAF